MATYVDQQYDRRIAVVTEPHRLGVLGRARPSDFQYTGDPTKVGSVLRKVQDNAGADAMYGALGSANLED